MKFFKASSWDLTVQLITVGIYMIEVILIVYNFSLTVLLLFGLILVIAPFYMIRGYSIDDDKLVIHRLGWTKNFDLHRLKSVNIVLEAMKGSWRLLGNGGLFGYIGTFSNKKLGTYRAYATNRYKCVVLELENRTLVVTPDAPEDLVEEVRELHEL